MYFLAKCVTTDNLADPFHFMILSNKYTNSHRNQDFAKQYLHIYITHANSLQNSIFCKEDFGKQYLHLHVYLNANS